MTPLSNSPFKKLELSLELIKLLMAKLLTTNALLSSGSKEPIAQKLYNSDIEVKVFKGKIKCYRTNRAKSSSSSSSKSSARQRRGGVS